jgi:FKBP-type peptidyl-prolyl cis-trans isomerase 2
MPIEIRNKVKVDYVGSFEDGTVFDSSEKQGKPLEFIAGIGQMIPGFDKALIGMEKGEEKEITLKPEEAYGEMNEMLIQHVPIDRLPKSEQKPEVGMMLAVGVPNGQQIPAKITGVSDTEIIIDANPPLAGKILKFKINVVDYSKISDEEEKEMKEQEEEFKRMIEEQQKITEEMKKEDTEQ